MSFPVIYSVLSCSALLVLIQENYTLPNIQNIEYYQSGLNDTYIVTCVDKKYVLRVYKNNWRTESDILCEIEVLLFLKNNHISVAAPITKKNGDILTHIEAPEGLRYVVLFDYASGRPPHYTKNHQREAEIYGRSFGKLHRVLLDFDSSHQRFKLNIDHLLEAPLKTIKPFLNHRPESWKTLSDLAANLRQQFYAYPENTLQFGFCHGDLNTGNLHINKNKATLFDFDCCGYGYHTADIANFLWGIRTQKMEDKIWDYFLDAYLKENNLDNYNIESIPMFASMRHFWHISLHLKLSELKGSFWINDNYFSEQISLLNTWVLL